MKEAMPLLYPCALCGSCTGSIFQSIVHDFNNVLSPFVCPVMNLVATTKATCSDLTSVFSGSRKKSAFARLHGDFIVTVTKRPSHTTAARINFFNLLRYPTQDSLCCFCTHDGPLLAVSVQHDGCICFVENLSGLELATRPFLC
jgi:hypothetical protein